MHRFLATFGVILLAASSASAENVRIPAGSDVRQFHNILHSATYGDTVWVEPGEYHNAILPSGIVMMASGDASETILRSSRIYVIKADGVDSLTVVDGFTLDGVAAAEGIVSAENSMVTIRNCILKHGWSGVRAMYSDLTVENCTITECQNGVYFYESQGRILNNEIVKCVNGMNLVSSSPVVQRNEVYGNSLGLKIQKHSDPSIGGSIASANRVYRNPGGAVYNNAQALQFGIRTMKDKTLELPYNYWGADCPDFSKFRGGPIEVKPWVSEDGSALEECPEPGPSSESPE